MSRRDPEVDSCVDCASDAEHCHAVWVRHPDGHGECLAVRCRVGEDAHLYVITCVEVDDACCG